MAKITYLRGRQILDSRGTPTVEVDMVLDDGEICRGSVPSGASTGSHEAIELRDGNKNEFNGKSGKNAIENINDIVKKNIEGKNFDSYEKFDDFLLNLDGTDNKSKLGANTILACSMTFLKCLAKNNGQSNFLLM